VALADPFKLEKLKIVAYSDRERESLVSTFEAMFNPASFSQDYEVKYGVDQGVNSSGTEARFTLSKPQKLTIDLLLDGTGVDTMGLLSPFVKTVPERVSEFLDTAYHLNGTTHEPNFLVVQWGDGLAFSCRLKKVTIAYSSFDRGGNPLRAKLTVTVVSDATAETIAATESLTSPDVTHTRIVRGGDTLPLLAKEIYGSSDHYLFVARFNGLDDFRDLAPGRELAFPPLEA
jgi:hypothetical protein